MPTYLPIKLWNVYRKDTDVDAAGCRKPICQVFARDRREALNRAEDKFGPDSRGWLYAHTVTGERAAAKLKNFGS